MRLVFVLAVAAAAGCSRAGFDVDLPTQSVQSASVASLPGALRVDWDGDVADAELELRVGEESVGTVSATRPATLAGLDETLEYAVRVVMGDVVSPEVHGRPLPAGALDRVPWKTISLGVASDGFGASLAVEDGMLVVGAPNENDGEDLEGAAHLYDLADLESAPLLLEQDVPYAMLGSTVAFAGDADADGLLQLLVASPNPFPVEFSDTAATPAGVLTVFEGAVFEKSIPGVANDLFGTALAARDIDANGEADVLVGAPGVGSATLVSGSLVFALQSTGAGLGYSVAIGDFDGDGKSELAIGEPRYGAGPFVDEPAFGSASVPLQAGRVHLFKEDGGNGFVTEGERVGPKAGSLLGATLLAQDLDGDGRDELIAAGTACGTGALAPSQPGTVWVWAGTAAGLSSAPVRELTNGAPCFGSSLAAGDVDGDGSVDLLVGDPSAGFDGEGELVAFPGGSTGSSANSVFGVTGEHLGASIGVADLDGDGRDDLFLGAPGEGAAAGAVRVIRSAPQTGPVVTLVAAAEGQAVLLTSSFVAVDGPAPDAYTCRWEWGDGTAANEVVGCAPGVVDSPLHAFEPGAHVVRFTVFADTAAFGETRFGEAAQSLNVSN